MGKLILGYEGVGLRTLVKQLQREGFAAVRYSAQSPDRLKELLSQGTYIFGRPWEGTIPMLDRNGIEFSLVYPAMNCKAEYVSRWVRSGRALKTVHELKNEWVGNIAAVSAVRCEKVICLSQGAFIPHLNDKIWTDVPFYKGNS